MQNPISPANAERRAFQLTLADGLWDVLIGCFVLEFAVAPLLSPFLGDFWSSAIFLPFWGLVYLGIRLARRAWVEPRLGVVVLGKARRQKLHNMTLVMIGVNTAIFLLGLGAFLFIGNLPGGLLPAVFGLLCLVVFSTAGYYLDTPRFCLYGLLLMAAPLVGEWLYATYAAPHHGFPVTFGFSAGLMILVGLVTFLLLLKNTPKAQIPDGA